MLISSLPHLPSVFAAKEIPLSRLQLNQRLAMLESHDTRTLRRIEAVMGWRHFALERTDQQLVDAFERMMLECEGYDSLRELIRTRFALLTIVAALRRRHNGKPAPGHGVRWGDERWTTRIERRWQEPAFGLDKALPWILEAMHHLENHDPVGLERLLVTLAWQHLNRAKAGHYFDFVAVAIYVLQFDLLEYWCGWDQEASTRHFKALLETGLGPYREVFP